MGGGYASVIGAETTYGVVRWNNSVRYDTPVFNGFQVSAIAASKQTSGSSSTYSTTMGAFNVAGATELSARYTAGPLKVLAVSETTQNTSGVNDTQRDLGVSYALSDALSVAAGQQNTNLNNTSGAPSKSAKSVSGIYTMGQNLFAVTYTSLTNTAVANTATELGLGYDYNLSKTTKLYARTSHLSDAGGASAFTASSNLVGTNGTHSYTKSAFGVQVNF
jgi:predicted porin